MRRLLTMAGGVALLAATPLAAQSDARIAPAGAGLTGNLVHHDVAVSRSFRVRVDTHVSTLTDGDGRERVHQRVARSMIDLYPIPDTGFRLSAGSRFVQRRGPSDAAGRGLFYSPRAGGSALRTGLRRVNPALTVGYTGTVAPRLSLGVEAGALKGNAWQRVNGVGTARGTGQSHALGSLVNLDATLKF